MYCVEPISPLQITSLAKLNAGRDAKPYNLCDCLPTYLSNYIVPSSSQVKHQKEIELENESHRQLSGQEKYISLHKTKTPSTLDFFHENGFLTLQGNTMKHEGHSPPTDKSMPHQHGAAHPSTGMPTKSEKLATKKKK